MDRARIESGNEANQSAENGVANADADPEKVADFAIARGDEESFRIVSRASKSFRGKFIKERTYRVTFTPDFIPGPVTSLLHILHSVFDKVLETAKREYSDGDMTRLFVTHPALHQAIIIPPRPLGDITTAVILEKIQSVLQSAQDLPLDTGFSIQLGVARLVPIPNEEAD